MRKIRWVITAASTDTEIQTKPNSPWSLATEILAHRKFVKLHYLPLKRPCCKLSCNSIDSFANFHDTAPSGLFCFLLCSIFSQLGHGWPGKIQDNCCCVLSRSEWSVGVFFNSPWYPSIQLYLMRLGEDVLLPFLYQALCILIDRDWCPWSLERFSGYRRLSFHFETTLDQNNVLFLASFSLSLSLSLSLSCLSRNIWTLKHTERPEQIQLHQTLLYHWPTLLFLLPIVLLLSHSYQQSSLHLTFAKSKACPIQGERHSIQNLFIWHTPSLVLISFLVKFDNYLHVFELWRFLDVLCTQPVASWSKGQTAGKRLPSVFGRNQEGHVGERL